ncbi:hypothetical protein RHHCN13_04345 [Rickettsia conorii subsp. heilongjiangensis]|uniref:Rod shape-determining protein MreD n=1 Tax=Rickettsia conorii subsp. heilongjiangensis TaxID=226665 RepID=A0AAD1LSU8_RICCR|nr:hypothetical protein [Rickettsia conorii]AEK74849.1 hypothetical protein Rh054_04655 [Rickettsia conorii subsp. heilongjiangensis 054]BBM91593.1 hypothetical protein RHCH81_04345 [Rickettsia conorii subsp. heilongjiangensis]BBM92801.1 hypothetical protein RHHCN13_04345 [Rickettsia conorii subsp. heilongjiangensis]BBM94010.1 hypothetical protein RHSENDAI29_04345 [Rickettsia conorii subsp. heilongjiangensis]BBM95219.1 hypothetical protein RHSENDAI58_04345 [Rickettsia conorii subsp. heilongjia
MLKIKQEIYKNSLQIILKLLFALLCFFIILFPLVSYKINIQSRIFPAMEIIFIYYFMSLYSLNIFNIFFFGLFIDQISGMPIGTNSLVFLSAYTIYKLSSKYFVAKNYLINFIVFCVYCLFILNFKYLLITIKKLEADGYLIIFFQFLTTIFSYNIIRLILDSPMNYFKKYAK